MTAPSVEKGRRPPQFDLAKAMTVTWWVCLPIMTIVATAWFGLVYGFNFRPDTTLGEMAIAFIIGMAIVMFVGGIVSLIAFVIFGPIAGLVIRRWGGERERNLIIALLIFGVGGALCWYLFYSLGAEDRLGMAFAYISLIAAPIYGVVLGEVITRKSNG